MAGHPNRVAPAYFDLLRQLHGAPAVDTSGTPSQVTSQRVGTQAQAPAIVQPRLLEITSLRSSCPHCNAELSVLSHHSDSDQDGVNAIVVAEPEAYTTSHRAKMCMRCCQEGRQRTKFWHGYFETTDAGKKGVWKKTLDKEFLPESVWMVNKSFGIHANWARKWRIRLYSHRSSFLGEGHILKALQPDTLPNELDNMLLKAWVRWQVWRRALGETAEVLKELSAQILTLDIEDLLLAIMPWYEPLMRTQRLEAWRLSGDRLDTLCFDGNAKLYRRTCGAPCAETILIAPLDLHLVRGCPESPLQKGVLCRAHAALRTQPELAGEIATHRMVQPLSESPFLKLEVQLAGFAPRWQPASSVDKKVVQAYFAKHGGEVVEARRQRRAEQREQRRNPVKHRFMGDWSSESAKTTCHCKTHKDM